MAQKKVEARNFDIRKQILKYDDVMNDQRKVIFEQRLDIMAEEDVSETIRDLRHQLVHELVRTHIPEKAYAEQWNTQGSQGRRGRHLRRRSADRRMGARRKASPTRRSASASSRRSTTRPSRRSASSASENFRQIEKMVLLQTLDHLWREHLVTLEHLRQVIGFRAYGQRDPLNEYKSEAFVLFEAMLARLREAVTGQLMHVELAPPDQQPALQPVELPEMEAHHIDPFSGLDELALADAAIAGGGRGDTRLAERRPPLQTRKTERCRRPSRSRHLGQDAAQRACARAARARSTSTATASAD